MAPALDSDGTVFVSAPSSSDGKKQALHVIRPDGSLKRKIEYAPAGWGIQTVPTVGRYGRIYVAGLRGQRGFERKIYSIHALSRDGEKLWTSSVQFRSNEYTVSLQSIGPSGRIYTRGVLRGDTQESVVALDPSDGSLLWQYELDNDAPFRGMYGGIKVGPDGNLYLESDGSILSLSKRGSKRWEYSDTLLLNPVLSQNSVIATTYKNKVVSLDLNGSLRWTHRARERIHPMSRAVGSNGRVYFGTHGNEMVILSGDGSRTSSVTSLVDIYDFDLTQDIPPLDVQPILNFLTLGGDGTIFTVMGVPGTKTERLVQALHTDGTVQWKNKQLAGYMPPAVGNGLIYTMSSWGTGERALKLFAIRTDSKALRSSPWPVFGHDNQNTFRLGDRVQETPDSGSWYGRIVGFLQWVFEQITRMLNLR